MKLSRRGFFSAVLAGVVTVPFVKGIARASAPPAPPPPEAKPAKKKIIWLGHSA